MNKIVNNKNNKKFKLGPNKVFSIDNKEYNSNATCVVNYSKDIQSIQRKQGFRVIANTPAALNSQLGKPEIECIIYNGVPNEYICGILDKVYYEAIKYRKINVHGDLVNDDTPNQPKDIYFKVKEAFIEYVPGPEPDYRADKKEYKQATHTARLENIEARYQGKRLPDERKAKMRKYLRYYEIDIPQTEPEWIEAFEQLAFYIRNKIPYSFDENLYYICPECGELIRRGTEEEHICFAEISPAKVHMDYIVNGEM